ncbi:uncharacterized protein LOC119672237 [Teleopsis dalmanni]|uniref:uncharacterized protein LOC119672237 n=1 Tax=Teleopsis dalmanni TaxID=139649 RepID=UPI0018CCBE3D|nr:uncharacterized protein LOC119672237 [Teleopsis dalmanni]
MFNETMKWILDYYECHMQCIMSIIGIVWNISNIVDPENFGKKPTLALISCAFVFGMVLLLSNLACVWAKEYRVSTCPNILRIFIYPSQIVGITCLSYLFLSIYYALFLVGEVVDSMSWMYFWKTTKTLTEQEPTLVGYMLMAIVFLGGISQISYIRSFIKVTHLWLLMKFKRPAPVDLVYRRGRYFDPVELNLHVQS